MSAIPIETTAETEFLDLALSRRALLAAGALTALALTLPALPARAAFVYGDVTTLRFLEEIARLQADFSLKAAMSAPAAALAERESSALSLMARQDAELMNWFGSARNKYGLSAFDGPSTLNQASSRPITQYRFPGETFQNRDTVLARALEIKGLAVGAFHGAVGAAKDPKLVEAFAALGGVQGRHLALLNDFSGQPPYTPFETALSRAEVATKLADYGFNREVLG